MSNVYEAVTVYNNRKRIEELEFVVEELSERIKRMSHQLLDMRMIAEWEEEDA